MGPQGFALCSNPHCTSCQQEGRLDCRCRRGSRGTGRCLHGLCLTRLASLPLGHRSASLRAHLRSHCDLCRKLALSKRSKMVPEGKAIKVRRYRGCREAVELYYSTLRPKILKFWPTAPHMGETPAGPDLQVPTAPSAQSSQGGVLQQPRARGKRLSQLRLWPKKKWPFSPQQPLFFPVCQLCPLGREKQQQQQQEDNTCNVLSAVFK